jgi:hypothetical protein
MSAGKPYPKTVYAGSLPIRATVYGFLSLLLILEREKRKRIPRSPSGATLYIRFSDMVFAGTNFLQKIEGRAKAL